MSSMMINRAEIYKKEIDPITDDMTRVIIGCGGVGSWMAIFLVLRGARNIILFDGDIVEESNLNRTLYRYRDIGKNKAEALKDILLELRPDINVIAIPEHYDPDKHHMLFTGKQEIWVCTDDIRTKKSMRNVPIITNDGEIMMYTTPEYWQGVWSMEDESESREYRRNTSSIFSAMAAILANINNVWWDMIMSKEVSSKVFVIDINRDVTIPKADKIYEFREVEVNEVKEE